MMIITMMMVDDLTANELSAYFAYTTWGVFYDHNYIENLILLSSWRGRVEYPKLGEMPKNIIQILRAEKLICVY